jgi:hypothetical protein
VRSFDDALAEYHRERDEDVLPMFEMTCEIATFEPPPPETQQLLAAIHGNPRAMDGFVQANAGTISPAAFFSRENVLATLAAAEHRTAAHPG